MRHRPTWRERFLRDNDGGTGLHSAAMKPAVAAGNRFTAKAAHEVLDLGGNAVDAAIAAALTAFVSEPLLASVGGAGMMTVATGEAVKVVDFFSHAPMGPLPRELDFRAIDIVFERATQVFHVGRGSAAAPMSLPGLALASEHFGRLPLAEVVAPAVRRAREGVPVTPEMAMVARLLWGIVQQSADTMALLSNTDQSPPAGFAHPNPQLADLLEQFGKTGESTPAFRQSLLEQFGPAAGGRLQAEDLGREPRLVEPSHHHIGDWQVYTSPRVGGRLIGLIIDELTAAAPHRDEVEEALRIARACRTGHRGRTTDAARDLGSTTHISVIDTRGDAAAVTLTNGEGCGFVVPGTGVHMNNFLGEEDLNPSGFHRHAAGAPLPSMIAPTIARRGEHTLVLGSGGSNRIRSVISQVLYRIAVLNEPVQDAVMAPRLHAEETHVWLELEGRPAGTQDALAREFEHVVPFHKRSFFFGGVHTCAAMGDTVAFGDPRRGGAI